MFFIHFDSGGNYFTVLVIFSVSCNEFNYISVTTSTEIHHVKTYSGPAKKKKRSLPVVLRERRDEVTLLVFRIEEENRPVQTAVLIQEDLSPRGLLRAEAVQAELRYRC